MGFTATIYNAKTEQQERFTDPALFEVRAAEVAKDKGYPRINGDMAKVTDNGRLAASTRKGHVKVTRKAWKDRDGYAVGAEIDLVIDGLIHHGQVWSLAPRNHVWVVDDEGAAWAVNTKTGQVWETMYPADAGLTGLCGEVAA